MAWDETKSPTVLNHLNWKEPAAMTITISDAIARTGVEVLDHLDRSAEVPVVSGLQRQGDVIVVPHTAGKDKGTQGFPPDGIAVVRGEAGGQYPTLSWRTVPAPGRPGTW